MSIIGFNDEQTLGLSGELNNEHKCSSVRCMHRIPAGFPSGIPGIGPLIDTTMQHAPQPTLHGISVVKS